MVCMYTLAVDLLVLSKINLLSHYLIDMSIYI